MKFHWGSLGAAILLSACGGGGDPEAFGGAQPDPFGSSAIPAALRGGGGGGTPLNASGGIPDSLRGNAGVVLDPEDIVFTDPDAADPDSIVPELKDLLSAAPTEGPWRKSYTNAFKEARHSDKPVLMWFTDSQNSPNCKALAEELFNQQEFEEWAEDHFVRLQLDQRLDGSKLDDSTARKAEFVKDLKKRYKILGQPNLLVLTPAGEVIGRYKGYVRGQAEFKWGQLRQAEMLASEAHQDWKKKMEKKNYRTWSDPRGRRVFAKLLSYQSGKLLLMEPDGTRFQTSEASLSPADQDWIATEKRKRGIE
jgi:thioredoxin-related protein